MLDDPDPPSPESLQSSETNRACQQCTGIPYADPSTSAASLPSGSKKPPRTLKISTCNKWVHENDKDLSTTVWLRYNTRSDMPQVVDTLKCRVCTQFEDKIYGCKNFTAASITGSQNLKTSSSKDHSASDMHVQAMALFQKSQCNSYKPTELTPIACSLSTMDKSKEICLCHL